MSIADTVRRKALTWFVAWSLAASLFVGVASLFALPAAAQGCARAGPPTPGDWTVSTAQVCENIVIVMDGFLIVTTGGTLTVRNGGLKFVEDTTHIYGITVSGGGDLILENSKVWTETNTINPYLKLNVTVSGAGSTLTGTNATFAFPGLVTASASAVATFSQGSLITRTEGDVAQIFSTDAARQDNDDAPGITIADSAVSFFASRIDNLYENTLMLVQDDRQAVRLQGTATFTAVDTFIGFDFHPDFHIHNTVRLEGSSAAYLYGVTADAAETQFIPRDQWLPGINATAGGTAYLYRWAKVEVVDANGVPVPGASVTASFVGPESGFAYFPDNGNLNYPPPAVLGYLGRTSADWNQTKQDGSARMPLLSEWINSTTMPNSRFVGTFDLVARSGANSGSAALTFSSYPAMEAGNASASTRIQIASLVQPLPDVTPLPPTFNPAVPKEGQTVAITATVANQGAGGAINVLVRVYDGITLLTETTIPFIAAGGQHTIATSVVNVTAGQHVIRVSVDPDNSVIEGPLGSPAESNNVKGFQLSVTPLGPDFVTDVSFVPDPGFLHNPVQLIAGVTNLGDLNASDVVVYFYLQETMPDASSTPIGSGVIAAIGIAGAGTASVNWTPTSLGSFRVWAWADPLNRIPEPAPYSEANNFGSNLLSIVPAPDLVTQAQDLTMTDPFPRVGSPITLEAVVRNNGQAIAAAPFRADMFIDGSFVGSQTRTASLAPGERWTFNLTAPAFATCGSHSLGIHVDAGAQVNEGSLYELNNRVTTAVQVYPSQVLTWSGGSIAADQAVSSSVEITGPVSITGARVTVVQDQDPCGRYYVKVLSGGSLTLSNAELRSNWPLVVFVADNGTLTADRTTFTLDVQGKGVLYSRGSISVRASTLVSDVVAKGQWADLRGDAFQGSKVHVNAASMSRIWDSTFPGVTTIELASDAPGQAAPDFDLRNVTFSAQLTNQLVFSGDQWVQLTSVGLTKPGDWWAGMLTQNARITRFFWINVRAVDGTSTLIQDLTTNVTLYRFDPVTLAWTLAPTCAPDECYFTSSTSWPAFVPTGQLVYRAAAEDRYGSLSPWVRATYRATGAAFIEGQARTPDRDVSALVTADTTMTLVFSQLTPDLSVTVLVFNGEAGAGVDSQPLNRPLTIVATVNNTGEIITRNVFVYFYSIDVDTDRNGVMDQPHNAYATAGAFIGSSGPLDVPARGATAFARTWTPFGGAEDSLIVSAVVDPSLADPAARGAIPELNERNNIRTRTIVAFVWPDLHFAGDPVVTVDPTSPIVNNRVRLVVAVSNEGTNTATDAQFGVFSALNASLGPIVTATIPRGASTTVVVTWVPTAPGTQTIRLRVLAAGGLSPDTFRNWDFDLTDNFADRAFSVLTQPELTVAQRGTVPSPFRGQPFDLDLVVNNTGQTTAPRIVVAVVDSTAPSFVLGAVYDLDVRPGSVNVTVRVSGLDLLGDHILFAVVDHNGTVNETDEANNVALITVTVQAPSGSVRIQTPTTAQSFRPGDRISVFGRVLQTDGSPIGGVNVTATLVDAAGNPVPGATGSQVSASNDGSFVMGLSVPTSLPEGEYRLRASAPDASISAAEVQVRVAIPVPWWAAPFLGLPMWIWLIVIIGAAAAVGGGTAYVKFVGLGKLVECGECGSFIPEDSTKCPKCGVEFEKDMAKCSNCQAWIPVDVKQCPECGVEFATGEVEMADYEAEMKRQYEDVKRRFRDEAQRELGRAMSEKEFEDWWRAQPTFVTFEDWLREEEDMRRMGSKPCPVCSTLNSVTAKVCHKCGTLLKETPTGRGGPPRARPPTPATSPTQSEIPEGGEATGTPPEAFPKKVVKKPIIGGPVVQKKIIRRPLEDEKKEGEQGSDEGEQF